MTAARNVELKARDPDPERTLAAALAHGAQDEGTLVQTDTYFRAREGRLKLREQDGAAPHLIAYARADAAVARTSTYRITEVPDAVALTAALDASLGTTVVVRKRRRLLRHENVRIHLDGVEGLGSWVELEAVVDPAATSLEPDHARVAALREVLGITDDRVVAEGYAMLLLQDGAATERLVELARVAARRAHAPYSHFHVGVAVRDEHGALHCGANVENASYPEGWCAETSAIGAMVAAGGRRVVEAAVLADTEMITPCGGCRQRLSEFADPRTPIHLCGPEGVRRTVELRELLPGAFSL